MAVIDDVRIMLGFSEDDIAESTDLGKKIRLMIANAEKQVLVYLPGDTTVVPKSLWYIVTELAIIRFNRIGNEGMASYSQEGESITFGDDISPYLPAMQAYLSMLDDNTKGVVRFL